MKNINIFFMFRKINLIQQGLNTILYFCPFMDQGLFQTPPTHEATRR